MKFDLKDYFAVSEDELVKEAQDCFHALKAFTMRMEGEIYAEDEYSAGPDLPLIALDFRRLYRYSTGAEPFAQELGETMSSATSFAIMVEELADGFESDMCPGGERMCSVIIQVYARYKIDHFISGTDSSYIEVISCLFDEEDLEGLTILQLALLSKLKVQSVRNKLSGESRFRLIKDNKGKHLMKVADSAEWLGDQTGFNQTAARESADVEFLNVPVARDGSFFRMNVRGKNGFRVGPKGSEIVEHDFDKALKVLSEMSSPYWRRPSEKTGVPGIVAGIRWERRAKSEVLKS
jgi:hypothetical protein